MTTTALPLERRIELVSDTLVNSFRFHASGKVAATIGTKDGPLAAPLFDYRVVSQDSIEIVGFDGRMERWTGIRIEGDLLHVERDGQRAVFTIGKTAP